MNSLTANLACYVVCRHTLATEVATGSNLVTKSCTVGLGNSHATLATYLGDAAGSSTGGSNVYSLRLIPNVLAACDLILDNLDYRLATLKTSVELITKILTCRLNYAVGLSSGRAVAPNVLSTFAGTCNRSRSVAMLVVCGLCENGNNAGDAHHDSE